MSTDTDDLTDNDVLDVMEDLGLDPYQREPRRELEAVVCMLDRLDDTWPQVFLGMPKPWQPGDVLELADPKELQNDGDPIKAAAMPPSQASGSV